MQDAARDLGRPSRLIAGSAGAAVALAGAAVLLMSLRGDPPDGFFAVPAAALVVAGFALLLGALRLRSLADALRAEKAEADRLRVALTAAESARVSLAEDADNARTGAAESAEAARRNLAEATQLREENTELSAEADQLRVAHGNLEAALTFKNDLTSMLTHDVAQPISSIASLAELLREDWDELPDDLRLELTTKIDKNTQRLIKMMNDLQLLFRLDTGSVTARRNPVPLQEIAQAVATSSGAPGEVCVRVDEDLSVLADRGHVQVVLQNLITNAITYGSKPVVVTAARHDQQVEVAVQDEGPGIADDLLPTLFGRFGRGAGLGLFIVRHLVEANGGTVRYEQATPHGARLVVTLEAAPV